MSQSSSGKLAAGLGLALLLTIASGLLHGRMSQRWGFDQRMDEAAARLAGFPSRLGDWQQENSYELSQSAVDLLSCRGYIHRGYRNLETGDYVKLAVMVGPGSKISIHVPEICYESSNFTLLESRGRYDVRMGDVTHAFWGVMFQVNDVSQKKLRVLYGWSDGGAWLAPTMPRWSVAGAPVLYKLQVSYATQDASLADPAASRQRVTEFLGEVVQALEPLLLAPGGNGSERAAEPRVAGIHRVDRQISALPK